MLLRALQGPASSEAKGLPGLRLPGALALGCRATATLLLLFLLITALLPPVLLLLVLVAVSLTQLTLLLPIAASPCAVCSCL